MTESLEFTKLVYQDNISKLYEFQATLIMILQSQVQLHECNEVNFLIFKRHEIQLQLFGFSHKQNFSQTKMFLFVFLVKIMLYHRLMTGCLSYLEVGGKPKEVFRINPSTYI